MVTTTLPTKSQVLKPDNVKAYSSVYEAEMAYDNKVHCNSKPQSVYLQRVNSVKQHSDVSSLTKFCLQISRTTTVFRARSSSRKFLPKSSTSTAPKTTAQTADRMKGLAFRFATIAAVSTGKDDYLHFEEISEFVAEGDAKTALISEQFDQGLDHRRRTLQPYRCCMAKR